MAFAIAALLIAPKFIDTQKYKPGIESLVSKTMGRPFVLGGELKVSLIPTACLKVNDVHLVNPTGFQEKDLVSVESFEVGVKFLPFVLSLCKEIQVERFILKGARIVLEKGKDGNANWEGIGKTLEESAPETQIKKEKKPESTAGEDLAIHAITIEEFAITDSSFVWLDHENGGHFEISDLILQTQDASLVRPIHFVFSAKVGGKPLSLDGKIGPLGEALGKGRVPFELNFSALKQLNAILRGSVTDAISVPKFALSLEVLPFSPRNLASTMGLDFPIVTADPQALNQVAFRSDIQGDPANIDISDGVVMIDESKLNFSCKARDFSKPNVRFDLKVDEIDLDRYLQPETEKNPDKENAKGTGGIKSTESPSAQKPIDYAPLRSLVLDGVVNIGKIKIADAKMKNLLIKISGKNGVFKLDPLSVGLYQGDLVVNGSLDVKQDTPLTKLKIKAKDIRSNPLLKDVLEKDILEGKFNADLTIQTRGDNAGRIKKTLNGKGHIFINDGAVKGIDMVSMVRNTDGAYGFADMGEKKPRTEFSEFQIPFTIKNGIFNTDNSRLDSIFLRVMTFGEADLVREKLNIRIEPTFVTTSKEDKDKRKRSEVMVPVLVTGSLYSPEFRPDLRGIAKQKLEEKVFESSKVKKLFEKEELKPYEEDVKRLLEGILDIPYPEEE